MRQFIYKALSILILVLLIDIIVGRISEHICVNLSDKLSQIGSISQNLMKKKGDVVILGASGAKYHYNCRILSDSLQMEVQNSGIKGMHAVYSDMVLQSFLQRQVPKCAVIDILGQLDAGDGFLPRVKPFYGISKPVTDYYDHETDWQQKLKLRSSLYRYNQTPDLFIRHLFNKDNTTNGFSTKVQSVGRIDTIITTVFHPDSLQLRHLDHIVNLCQKHHILLALVLSPRAEHNIATERWVTDYCKRNNIVLINEFHEPVYYERDDLFFDNSHLNNHGSEIFSKRIASQLKRIITDKKSNEKF